MLRNAVGVGGCQFFREKTLRRCTVQRYEGVGGGHISRKKALRNTLMAPGIINLPLCQLCLKKEFVCEPYVVSLWTAMCVMKRCRLNWFYE